MESGIEEAGPVQQPRSSLSSSPTPSPSPLQGDNSTPAETPLDTERDTDTNIHTNPQEPPHDEPNPTPTPVSNSNSSSSKTRPISGVVPPWWQRHERNISRTSQSSLRNTITLEDHTADPDSETSRGLWARSVSIDDHCVVQGMGVGAYVVWNCTIQTLDVCFSPASYLLPVWLSASLQVCKSACVFVSPCKAKQSKANHRIGNRVSYRKMLMLNMNRAVL